MVHSFQPRCHMPLIFFFLIGLIGLHYFGKNARNCDRKTENDQDHAPGIEKTYPEGAGEKETR